MKIADMYSEYWEADFSLNPDPRDKAAVDLAIIELMKKGKSNEDKLHDWEEVKQKAESLAIDVKILWNECLKVAYCDHCGTYYDSRRVECPRC